MLRLRTGDNQQMHFRNMNNAKCHNNVNAWLSINEVTEYMASVQMTYGSVTVSELADTAARHESVMDFVASMRAMCSSGPSAFFWPSHKLNFNLVLSAALH